MAVPTTNIKITDIQIALGEYSEYRVSYLVKSSSINEWARFKPGYLKADGTANKFIIYQQPRGASYTDPRGYNSDSGSSVEHYRMGDYRGYNHSATPPSLSEPASTIEFSSSTPISFGISLTFYVREIEWDNGGVYRSRGGWADFTHILLLDASDNSIEGFALIPAIGGSVSIELDGVAMSQGVPVTKTYHIALGVDETHWSVKVGTRYGASGISDVTVLRLEEPQVYHAAFNDNSFYEVGVFWIEYTSADLVSNTNTNRFVGNTVIWDYSTFNNWRCYHSSGSNDFRSIKADWYIKGFVENPSTWYKARNQANFASNGANNTVDLSSMVDTPPRAFWKDGDKISLELRNLEINF